MIGLLMIFFVILPTIGVALGLVMAGRTLTKEQAERRRYALDDDPVKFDDWICGTPDQRVPDDAVPIDFRNE